MRNFQENLFGELRQEEKTHLRSKEKKRGLCCWKKEKKGDILKFEIVRLKGVVSGNGRQILTVDLMRSLGYCGT